ncbi:MAG: prepilin-type N-terminal cleavage/methylation domain-containing protein [Patescibacteria group bacterium]|nr:prepilin-type N-terminal cleavage/methylation domain-containing protein [Patescibacteria group bacterium]
MKKKKSLFMDTRGITLVEILIVTAIMSILLGISFVGYNERGEELQLQRAAFKVMADIEKTRGMAMSAQEEKISEQIPEGGWGIYFNPALSNKYIIFPDKRYLAFPLNYIYDAATEEPEEEIFLEDGVLLDIPLPINIVFSPPSPDVYLQGGAPISEINVIIALENNPSKTKTIVINSAGVITTNN